MKKTNKEVVKCPKCNNVWATTSKKILISCTSCGSKIKRGENQIKDKGQEVLK